MHILAQRKYVIDLLHAKNSLGAEHLETSLERNKKVSISGGSTFQRLVIY